MDAPLLVILIVDHSLGDRLLVRQLLARTALAHAVVREAAPGDHALAAVRQSPPDCVLLAQNGLAALAALRVFSDVPVVLLADVGAETLALEALQHGAQDYLVADELTPERLQRSIQRAIEVARLTRERDQARATLQASEEHVRLIASHAHDLIYRYRLTPEPAFEYVSPAATAITGYTPEEHYADPQLGFKLVHPDDRHLLERVSQALIDPGEPLVLRWQRKDGRLIWTEQLNQLITDEAGRALAIEGIARDVTQRHYAEEALRASQQNLAALIDNTDGKIWSVDTQYRLIVGNALFQRDVTAVSPQEVRPGTCLVTLPLPQDALERWRGWYDRALAGETFSIAEQLRFAPEPRMVEYRFSPIRDGAGAITGVTVFGRDLTERRAAQRALEYERQQLAAIVQTLHEGLVAFTPDGTIAVINEAMWHMGGIGADLALGTLAAVGQAMGVVPVHADGQPLPPSICPFARILRGERFSDLELRMWHPSREEERWLVISGTPVYDAQGMLVLGIVTAHDITQRKRDAAMLQTHVDALSRTNAELTRALMLKDEFLAMMSHELRTPLTAVLGITDALDEELYGPLNERQRKALATATQSGQHLLAILSDILDLSHLDAGKAPLQLQPVDVDRLCRAAIQLVAATSQQKGIRLLRSVQEGIQGLCADERRLTQILTNLLDNAVKFTPQGGTVGLEVTGDAAQEQIMFAVWDTGIGIAEADYERLFQPFTQVDGRLSRKYEGIGLGLTLVRRLVDMHGGSISLESTPGQGSRFTVSLSWATGENVALPPPRSLSPPPPRWTQHPRLVIADDHEPTLQLYAELLHQQGCQVVLARTGAEAVAQVRATRPDVVVLDIQMPELDGLSAIRQIRADAALAAVPIIALTALAMPGDRERCVAAGANVYLAKPVGISTLLAVIAALLAGSDAGRPGA